MVDAFTFHENVGRSSVALTVGSSWSKRIGRDSDADDSVSMESSARKASARAYAKLLPASATVVSALLTAGIASSSCVRIGVNLKRQTNRYIP